MLLSKTKINTAAMYKIRNFYIFQICQEIPEPLLTKLLVIQRFILNIICSYEIKVYFLFYGTTGFFGFFWPKKVKKDKI